MGSPFLSLAQSFKKVVRKKLRRWLTRFCPFVSYNNSYTACPKSAVFLFDKNRHPDAAVGGYPV